MKQERADVPREPPARLTIRATRGIPSLGLRELFRHRELVYFLAWRDVKVRYKQTALGVLWALLQPLSAMLVFTVIFGRVVGVPSDGAPYPLFVLAGLLPWQLFAYALTSSSQSVVANQGLITKVYFPRLVVPVSSIVAGLLDVAIGLALFALLLVWHGRWPTVWIATLPLFVLTAIASALGVGLWLCALNVRYRDVRYMTPFLAQIWMFATPIVYPTSFVPAEWRWLFALNPLVGVVDGFRLSLLGVQGADASTMAVSFVTSGAILLSGVVYFRHMERGFADTI